MVDTVAKRPLTSQEATRSLGVSDCQLAHLRNCGRVSFKKNGRAFAYYIDSAARKAAAELKAPKRR